MPNLENWGDVKMVMVFFTKDFNQREIFAWKLRNKFLEKKIQTVSLLHGSWDTLFRLNYIFNFLFIVYLNAKIYAAANECPETWTVLVHILPTDACFRRKKEEEKSIDVVEEKHCLLFEFTLFLLLLTKGAILERRKWKRCLTRNDEKSDVSLLTYC